MTTLFFRQMRIDPKNPKDPNRDRFVLSKGHSAPCYYAVLAERGFISRDEFTNFPPPPPPASWGGVYFERFRAWTPPPALWDRAAPSLLVWHWVPSTGGQDVKVYTLLGDGECQEGQIWEAFMSAAHYKLDNLTVIIDNNGLQIDGPNDEVMSLGDLPAKLRAFGFDLHEIDGHDLDAIAAALGAPPGPGKPKCILAHTVKGKGVSFMEDQVGWHGKAPNEEGGTPGVGKGVWPGLL